MTAYHLDAESLREYMSEAPNQTYDLTDEQMQRLSQLPDHRLQSALEPTEDFHTAASDVLSEALYTLAHQLKSGELDRVEDGAFMDHITNTVLANPEDLDALVNTTASGAAEAAALLIRQDSNLDSGILCIYASAIVVILAGPGGDALAVPAFEGASTLDHYLTQTDLTEPISLSPLLDDPENTGQFELPGGSILSVGEKHVVLWREDPVDGQIYLNAAWDRKEISQALITARDLLIDG